MAGSSSNMDISINQPSIPIFDRENYNSWSIEMKILFILQVWDFVKSVFEVPSILTNQQREPMEYEKKKCQSPLLHSTNSV